MPLKRMRELFTILEQQRTSRNAVELGGPSEQRMADIELKKKAETDAKSALEKSTNDKKSKETATKTKKT